MRSSAFLLLSAVLAALVLAAWFIGERMVIERHRLAVRADVQNRLDALRDRLSANVRANVQSVQGLVSLLHLNPSIDQRQFERAARPILAGGGQLRNIAVAPDLVIRLMAPLQGNEMAVGLDYRTVPKQLSTVEWARLSRGTVLAGPLPLVQGGVGLIARVPVFMRDDQGAESFWGVVSAVIDVERLYADSGLLDPGLPMELAIRGRNATGPGGEVFFGRPELFDSEPARDTVEFPGGSWQIAAIPLGGWPAGAPDVWILRAGFVGVALVVAGLLFALNQTMRAAGRAHARARQSERQTQQVADHLPALISRMDSAHRYTFANRTYQDWFGVRPQDMMGRRVDEVFGAERYARLRPHIEQVLASREQLSFEDFGPTRQVSGSYVPDINDDGEVTGLFSLITDITELKAVQRQLSELARRDELTGLLNRRSFDEALAQALARARRSRAGLGLMSIDVDRFKAINDTQGHAAGDAVLTTIAARMKRAVREVDEVARIGGDEFLILFDALGESAARKVADKIAAAMRVPVELPDGGAVDVSVSIGVALASGGVAVDASALLAAADGALYAAKRAGRDQFSVVHCGESTPT